MGKCGTCCGRPNDETSMLRYFNARVRTSKIMILHLQDTTLKHKISFYKIQEPSVDCTWINRRPDLWYVENPQRVCGPGRRVGYMSGISRISALSLTLLFCCMLPPPPTSQRTTAASTPGSLALR